MLYVSLDDRYGKKTFSFARASIVVGRGDDADLILDTPGVAPAHIRIHARDGHVVVEDARGRLPANHVTPGDVVRVGGIALRIVSSDLEPEDVGGDVEQRFLDAIGTTPADPATREVYADWLEASGDGDRAAFVRTQAAPAGKPGWRARVAMTVVEGCKRLPMDVVCPQRWDALSPTRDNGVRHCSACARDVTYCTTIDQAQAVASNHGCVAVDIAVKRQPHDLMDRRMMVMGRPSPPLARYGRRA